MTKTKTGDNAVHEYRANVPFLKAPKITKEKTIAGTRYYFSGDKVYYAEQFDRFFKAAKGLVNPNRFHKGNAIGLKYGV